MEIPFTAPWRSEKVRMVLIFAPPQENHDLFYNPSYRVYENGKALGEFQAEEVLTADGIEHLRTQRITVNEETRAGT